MPGDGGRLLLFALATAVLLWGGWKWSEVWHYRKTLARVEDAMDRDFTHWRRKIWSSFLTGNPGSDEVAFLLGTCEKARGRTAGGR